MTSRSSDLAPSTGPDLRGLRALVTGGTRGIGAGVAEHLQRAGADVVVAARSHPDGPHAGRFVRADLADADGVEALVDSVMEILGGVDVLVDNVGSHQPVPGGVLATSEATWMQDIATNLLSTVRLDRALVPAMVERGHGVVVHISSGAARWPQPSGAAYAAAKAGLNAYSKALATEVAPHGVRVNAVLPGFIASSAMDDVVRARAQEAGQDPDQVRDQMLGQLLDSLKVPAGRAGDVGEVGALVAFLASPAATYISGAQLVIDGGLIPTL